MMVVGLALATMAFAGTAAADGRAPRGRPVFDPQAVAVAHLNCNVAGMSYTTVSINASNPTDIDIASGTVLRWRTFGAGGNVTNGGQHRLSAPLAAHRALQLAVIPQGDIQGCDFNGGPITRRPEIEPRVIDRGPMGRPVPRPGPVRGQPGR